jgi:hypothetical protein
MFCPRCESEYREGFTRCSDCDVELVAALPSEDHDPDSHLVPVLSTSDATMTAIVKSLFDEAGIGFLTRNEALQDMLGGGRLGGMNLVLGPVEFWVREDQESAARELVTKASDALLLEEPDTGTEDE